MVLLRRPQRQRHAPSASTGRTDCSNTDLEVGELSRHRLWQRYAHSQTIDEQAARISTLTWESLAGLAEVLPRPEPLQKPNRGTY
ncbi:MAG TPA: hypothetical protein V6C72_13630, partial [Chroococcales cyanobacterium]